MKIAIRSTEAQKQELAQKGFGEGIYVFWIESNEQLQHADADVFFDLVFDDTTLSNNKFIQDKPVFAHAVNCMCTEINKPNYIRLNAWNGFLNRPLIELVCNNEASKKIAETVFDALQWKYVWVNDEHGFIAARIISMIINEAYYALEDNVSTKAQIDIAMKLGTNYPYGPFEWGNRIGLKNVFSLLRHLEKQDTRYAISALLGQESQQF
jgi:3-hydroxybutyryl-CoA dehydrogenase